MKSKKFRLIAALSLLGVLCLCTFLLLTIFVPFFPNISKIIEIKQAENKYKTAATELCNDTAFVKNIHDSACYDLLYLNNYTEYTVAPREMEKIVLSESSKLYIYKRLELRAQTAFDFPCPSCDTDTIIKNSYKFSFQINNYFIGQARFDIKDQNSIIDLNEDLQNTQNNGNRYIWILFYNPSILDTYQLFSIDKTTNKIENLAVPIELNEHASNINLDPDNLKVIYTSDNQTKTVSIDLDTSEEVTDLGPSYPLRESTGVTISSNDYTNIAKVNDGYTIYSYKIQEPSEGEIQPYNINYSIVPTGSVYDDPNIASTLPAIDNFSGLKKIGITLEDLKIILNNLPEGQKVFWARQDFATTQNYKFVPPLEKSIRELENVCKINNLVCDFKFI